jgi:hypothetical protein
VNQLSGFGNLTFRPVFRMFWLTKTPLKVRLISSLWTFVSRLRCLHQWAVQVATICACRSGSNLELVDASIEVEVSVPAGSYK